jgi:hypothetical protein
LLDGELAELEDEANEIAAHAEDLRDRIAAVRPKLKLERV